MTISSHAQQLRLSLKTLDSVLVPSSAPGRATPVAPKINEGCDRFGGYPPAC